MVSVYNAGMKKLFAADNFSSTLPKTKPENDSWYMNPSQPVWKPDQISVPSSSSQNRLTVPASRLFSKNTHVFVSNVNMSDGDGSKMKATNVSSKKSPYVWTEWWD